MDPTAALEHLRERAKAIRAGFHDGAEITGLAINFAYDFQDLDNWLTRGGFPPTQWRHTVVEATTNGR